MAEAGESANVDLHEHLDNALVMLLLITLFVTAMQAVGRYIGNRTGQSGVTAFFGG
jgi:hypothetical protein